MIHILETPLKDHIKVILHYIYSLTPPSKVAPLLQNGSMVKPLWLHFFLLSGLCHVSLVPDIKSLALADACDTDVIVTEVCPNMYMMPKTLCA